MNWSFGSIWQLKANDFNGRLTLFLPFVPFHHIIDRQLAEISKSTRGVVLLLCNLETARKIMSEAQRLNMVGGHFIWLWADTSSTTEFYDTASSSGSAPRAPAEPLRGVDVPGSSSQSVTAFNRANGTRDKSRMPVVTSSTQSSSSSSASSSSSSSSGRQRENERRTDQRGVGRSRKQQQANQQQGGPRRDKDRDDNNNKENSKRERFHLPVAGRSRPVSEQNDKSRNRRDLANPTIATSSYSPISPSSLHNEQLASSAADGDGVGDNEFYDNDDQVSDEGYDDGGDPEEDRRFEGEAEEEEVGEGEAAGYAESERRILELLRKAPARNTEETRGSGESMNESIRLAGDETSVVDDKWAAGNRTSSTDPSTYPSSSAAAAAQAATTNSAKPSLSDIDPVIKFGADAEDAKEEEEVAKLKRTLNLANMNNSDVLFHHFKDFPIGLLALRPVRMTVDRNFIRATVQLFANTWKRVDGASVRAMDQSRSWQFDGERWRRKRRRKRSDLEGDGNKIPETSDKLGVMESSRPNVASQRKEQQQRDLFNGAADTENNGRVGGGDAKLRESVVNNTLNQLNQSFNASDLGQRVNYQRPRDPNARSSNSSSSSTAERNRENNTTNRLDGEEVLDKETITFYGYEDDEEGSANGNTSSMADGDKVNSTATTSHIANTAISPAEVRAALEDSRVGGEAQGHNYQQRDESGLHEDYISKTRSREIPFKGRDVAKFNGDIDAADAEIRSSTIDDDTMSNTKIKAKRKYGVGEQQQEVIQIRSGGGPEPPKRQQILGAWTKPGRGGSNSNLGGRRQGSPQYEGGCYGTPTRSDVKRAESFARYV